MAKEIWLGPLLGNNRKRLIDRCATLVSQGAPHSFLYLAASHPLLEIVTAGILDGDTNRGLWSELPIYLFRGFIRRVLANAVDDASQLLSPRVPIDEEELPLKRSLVSQILLRLVAAGQLQAIAPLAGREGCVNTIATLIGEIERAAKTPAELQSIIAERVNDLEGDESASLRLESGRLARQIDFDEDVGLIYSAYCELLNQHRLTEADADSLRALQIMNGELDGQPVSSAWLEEVEVLVLDGFFDFTPVQSEILRRLIPGIPNVIVNLNYDERNPEIFRPFQTTIEHLSAIAPFETHWPQEELIATSGALSNLRERLFNPAEETAILAAGESSRQSASEPVSSDSETNPEIRPAAAAAEIKYFECGDRDTEIRAVCKEIKRLVLCEGYQLSEMALVVRQRTSYAETIARVLSEESLPCNLESRVKAHDIPGLRAAVKLLDILEEFSRDPAGAPRLSQLADLIKSEYFRLSEADLQLLAARFDDMYPDVLRDTEPPLDQGETTRRKQRHRIGLWDADALENTFAYVGSQLRVSDWLNRAYKLIKELPSAAATKELLNIDTGEEQSRDPDESDQIENAETAKIEERDVEKKRRPSRDIHPGAIAWAALVIAEFAGRIRAVPQTGTPAELRLALMKLLEDFCFREQIVRPIRDAVADRELPKAMLNFNSLEALRRAFVAAIKSIEIAASLSTPPRTAGEPALSSGADQEQMIGGASEPGGVETQLYTFVDEVRRSIGSQSQPFVAADARGLRVLEATDVRGLRFRAVFIVGLVEGGFPLRASRDWIYPHEERERLKRHGLTLEDISPATLLKEEHYFYQAACRATERLYLSRPLSLADDSETVASYYLDELRRAVAPLLIETETMRRDYDGRDLAEISRISEMNVALVRQQERHFHDGDTRQMLPEPRIKRLLTLARNDELLSGSAMRRIEIERERAGNLFGPYDGQITDPDLLALINQRFGRDFLHSASSLSLYGNCAYRYFGQRVLKLAPRGEAALDLQAIDAGKLLHDILRRFFERHRRQPLYQLDRAALQLELQELADRVFDEHEQVVPPLNKQIWKIDREIRKILLDQVLLYELDIQEKASGEEVLPAYFEVSFGSMRSGPRDPQSTQLPLLLARATFVGEETIKISGQIDRVDVARDQTLVAYDYKLSTGSSKEDIRSGRSLQLPIYLEALEKLILPDHNIAGGGYYIIRGGNERRNKGLHRVSALAYSGIGARTGAVISDDEWRQIRSEVIGKVWEFLDQMRAGQFSVNPAEREKTCRFCDFAAVCRYDRYRIEQKKKSIPRLADYSDPIELPDSFEQ